MTIIVFLIDTSASMNQRTYMGTTMLDVSKGAVETFMKIRSRDPNCRWDRYMLLTFDDPPANVRAGWKESHATFMRELKNLDACGLSTLGPALKHTFDLLNVNRMVSGIDTYGQGRCPFYLEPAIIICLTDGGKMTAASGSSVELNLPMTNAAPGSELTKEPFRWDQRVFGVVLHLPATAPADQMTSYIPSAADTPLDAMCEVTGGRSYSVTSQRTLLASLESLAQKCQSGVVVNFEKIDLDGTDCSNDRAGLTSRPVSPSPSSTPAASSSWQNCRRLIYVPRSATKGYMGHWPIPESFWPDVNNDTLPPRSAHPVIKFSCLPCEPLTLDNLPFDKYELEPSPLTQYILERRQPNIAWQVFIANSAKYGDIGHAFGYLKASSTNQVVNLVVMPYNYSQLIPLLDELFKVHKLKPNQMWKQKFDTYLKMMPIYYAAPLKRAMKTMGSPSFVLEQINESMMSYAVVSYLKKLKNQAKMEYDRLVASVGQSSSLYPAGIHLNSTATAPSILHRADFHQLLTRHGGDLSSLTHELSVTEYDSFVLAVPGRSNSKSRVYTNPFDIARKDLLTHIRRMRVNYMKAVISGIQLQEAECRHNMCVQEMGNYQEYLRHLPQPLREIDTQPARQHTFGNPFKVNKNIMIDEADEVMPGQQVSRKRIASELSASPRPNKRKPGPLPKGISARTLMSPVHQVSSPPLSAVYQVFDSTMTDSDYNEDYLSITTDDEALSTAIDTNSLQSSHHIYGEANGVNGMFNCEHLLDTELTVDDINISLSARGIIRRQSSVSSTATYSPSDALATINGLDTIQHNRNIREKAVIETKRPGKDHVKLFNLLSELEGSASEREHCIRFIMTEAQRFKRLLLVRQLDEFLVRLLSPQSPTLNNKADDNFQHNTTLSQQLTAN